MNLIIQGELRPLRRALNPWGYDQFLHLRPQKIDGVIWPDYIQRGETVSSLRVILNNFQSLLADVYDQTLPPNDAAIMKGMILGIRQDIDQNTSDIFRIMGIYHILSISGLHITVLLLSVNKLLGRFVNERRAMVLALVIMSLYCLMTGAEVATVRAVLMGGVLVFGKLLYRERDNLATISIAAIILLVYEPLYIFNAGFQLSFGAMYGMGVLTHPIERLIFLLGVTHRPKYRDFISNIAAGISALVSTYIIASYHFFEIPLYGVFGNLVIMPVSTILLVLGIIAAVLGVFWMPVAHILMGSVYFSLRLIEVSGRFLANLPFASLHTGGGSLVVALLGFMVLGLFCYAFHGFERAFKKRLILLGIGLAILACMVLLRAYPPGLDIVHVMSDNKEISYTVLRHRNYTVIVKVNGGNEFDVIRLLDMYGKSTASLFLGEPIVPRDVHSLSRLAPMVSGVYVPGNTEGVSMSLMQIAIERIGFGDNVSVNYLNQGDVMMFGRLEVRVMEDHIDVMDAAIARGNTFGVFFRNKIQIRP